MWHMRIRLAFLVMIAGVAAAQTIPQPGDWPMYNHDIGSTRYSELKQLTPANVAKLRQAWTFTLPGASPAIPGFGVEVVPIVIHNVMFVPSGNLIIAIEADTGREIWRYQVTRGPVSARGVAYWPGDAQNRPRIIFTAGRNLIALNAATGALDPGFGREGMADMVVGWGGVPTILGNTISVGASVNEAEIGPPGNTRAFDARTGAKIWEFHTVAQPGEPGHETWLNDGWKNRSGTNVWAWSMSGDTARNAIYMPVDGPASNYYGGDRPGANLYGNSVVAVDAATGKYKWHFQTVHHDLWDFDNPPAPVLLEISQGGKKVPVLAQVGKTGYMFILNRDTGRPVFGVEERPVAKGDVPGEWYSPTQPFPLKPPPLARVSYRPEDIVTAEDTTAEHAKNCAALVEKSGGFYNAGPFTPFLYHEKGAPPKSTMIFPGALGGTNWGGMATDQKLGYVFAYTGDQAQIGWMESRNPAVQVSFEEVGTKLLYWRGSATGPGGGFATFSADAGGRLGTLPCQKPPWGRLTAVNANTGEMAWQVPLGVTDGLPAAKQNTGRAGALAGPTATAGGLVFIGATSDNRFRAFDSKSGKLLWEVKLENAATANPVTYQGGNGKQYVAILAGGTVNAYNLP